MGTPIEILNGDFELGDNTGWTGSGGMNVVTQIGAAPNTKYAFEGTYFVASNVEQGLGVVGTFLSDYIDLVAEGIPGSLIDSGVVEVVVKWYQLRFAINNDEGRAVLLASDTNKTSLGVKNSAWTQPSSWTQRSLAWTLPVNTRYLRIQLASGSDVGTYPSAFFDKVTLEYTPASDTVSFDAVLQKGGDLSTSLDAYLLKGITTSFDAVVSSLIPLKIAIDRYRHEPLPEQYDASYFQSEFLKLEVITDLIIRGSIESYHVEPEKVRDGLIVIADGTDWNPGSGIGMYYYYNGGWRFLG